MRGLYTEDVFRLAPEAAIYAKKTFTGSLQAKWLPAGLCALFVDMASVFDELFWIVVLLLFCDFGIGVLRAWHDPTRCFETAKAYGSIMKLVVIGIGTYAVHLIERLIFQAGIDTQEKLVGATLVIIGVSEAYSIVDNLTYFFPGLVEIATKVRSLLGKGRNGHDADPGGGADGQP